MFPFKMLFVVYPIFRRTHGLSLFSEKQHRGPLQAHRVEMPIQAFVGCQVPKREDTATPRILEGT